MVRKGLLGVLLTISLAGCVYGNYFIVSPNKFRPETVYRVEVSYIGGGSVNVEATLGISGTAPLDSKTSPLENGRVLIPLTIPSQVPEGSYMLTVVGRGLAGNELFRNSSQIQVESDNSLLLIQLDKPMYKPLQTIKFRIVFVDQDLKPRTEPTDISIFDQNDNKLEEWLAVQGVSGVIEKTYQLSDLPPLGTWRIQARNEFGMNTKEFSVEKYVLPKFEVLAEAEPKFLITGNTGKTTEFSIKVTAKYTYGKDVVGKATFIFDQLKSVTAPLEFDSNGVHTQIFSVSEFSNIPYNGLKVSVNVTESSTMVTESSNLVNIPAYQHRTKIEFLPTSSEVFRPGLSVVLQLKVSDLVDNAPAHIGSTLEVSAYIGNENRKEAIVVDNQGLVSASFQIPTDLDNTYGITFTAKLTNKDGPNQVSRRVLPYRTKLNTMLEVDVPTSQPVLTGSNFEVEIVPTGSLAQVAYMVISRGVIVESGRVDMTGQSKTIVITATRRMSPLAQVVVYGIVTVGEVSEVIADSVDVKVEGVFDNQVSLAFSKDEGRSGTNVDVTVTSAPDSKFYILAVDKSVMLLGTGNDLSESEVLNGMKKFNLGETMTLNDGPEPHFRGDVMFPPGGSGDNDAPTSAGQLLKQRGLQYMSGVIVEEEPERRFHMLEDGNIMFKMRAPSPDAESAGPNAGDGGAAPTEGKPQYAEVGRTRKFFPEAWLWMDGSVSSDGTRTFTETIPDTITEWIATAFAIHTNKGLAITDTSAKLTSFQPFFASMTLPYAIRRGEVFQLRVTVNNYMQQSTAVKVTLKKSDEFGVLEKSGGKTEIVAKDVVQEIQVEPKFPGLVIFEISAKKLGLIKLNVVAQPEESTGEKGDSLERNVLVKPEGIVQREVVGETVELDGDNPNFNVTIPITFPDEVVPGSKRIEIKVTGDVMGPTVDGLERLVQMPTGCGEQNMITLVPNIVVYNYLKTVNRLTNDIGDKAIKFMKAGYQRELGYKRKDGSFSAFGESDKSGSTWLTAFVMKCFSMARKEITVDTNMMKKAFAFLKRNQNDDGTFNLVGTIHHQEMLGGSSAKDALAAFILIALSESETFLSETDRAALTKTQQYLENLVVTDKLSSTYEMAIIAYALTLSDSVHAATLLEKLESREKPWEGSTTEKPSPDGGQPGIMPYYPRKATAGDVETWSYVLMSYAERKDIVLGRPIMKWLLTQQNGQGGFFSTQDTVLGLQGLAEYAAVVYEAPQTDITLVTKANKESHTFSVQKEKLILLQSYVLQFPDDTTSIQLSATGRGLAVVKILWQYNTLKNQQKKTDTKEIKTTVETNKITDDLYRVKCCFKSEQKNLGMTVMSLQLQTQMSVANVKDLENDENIMRVDTDSEYLHLYYNQPESEFQCANVNVQKDAPVMNLQKASLKTVVYYQPEIEEEMTYTVADAQQIDICDICSGNACPEHCDKCKNCGNRCPSHCDTSSANTWNYQGMVLSLAICLLISLITVM